MPVNTRDPEQTELSIIDIHSLAWNASQGSANAYNELKRYHKKYAKLANSRMRALEKADIELSAYNRAITYLQNMGKRRFSTILTDASDYKGMVKEMSELITFLNSKTSKVKCARAAINAKLDKISEYTGTVYDENQRKILGKLLGDDSISTLLREVRGDSGEVIDFLEEVSTQNLDSENIQQLSSIIDRHLAGYNPFSDSPFFDNLDYLSYDELMDVLRNEFREK